MALSARARRPDSARVTVKPASARKSEPGTPREEYPLPGEHFPRECYTGDDLGGRAATEKGKGWATKWRPPSAPTRKPETPGTFYLPSDTYQGPGPTGHGPSYSMHHSHRVHISERKYDHGQASPGPIYMVKVRRHPAGKFSTSPRNTSSGLPSDGAPVPFYDLRKLKPPRQVRNGLGTEERFPRRGFDNKPGPGDYKLPPTVGGCHPSLSSKPVPGFNKDKQCDPKFFLLGGKDSPGPVYALPEVVGGMHPSLSNAGRVAFTRATVDRTCARPPDRNYYQPEPAAKASPRRKARPSSSTASGATDAAPCSSRASAPPPADGADPAPYTPRGRGRPESAAALPVTTEGWAAHSTPWR